MADANPFSKANYVPSGAGGRLATLERENAAQAAQKDEQLAQQAATSTAQAATIAEQAAQLAQKDATIAEQAAQLAQQTEQLAQKDATITQQAARIAELGAAAAPEAEAAAAAAGGANSATFSAATFALGSCGDTSRLAHVSVDEKNAIQKAVLALMPAGDVRGYCPELLFSYATGQRDGDAEGAGPGLVVAAKLIKRFKDSGMPSFSGLHVPDGHDWKMYFEKLDSRTYPEQATCRVLLVLMTRAFYRSLNCLEEVATALKCPKVTLIIPLRIEDLPFDVAQWPTLDDDAKWVGEKKGKKRGELLECRTLVKREFGKLNSLPPPGSTLLHSPIYVNDLVAAVAKHLGVDAERTFNNSLEARLRTWVVEGVPSAHDAEVARCKKELDELEGRAKWADAADDAACAAVKALLEPCTSAIRATAQAFKSEEQVQELHAVVEAGDKVYLDIYAGMHKQVCCY